MSTLRRALVALVALAAGGCIKLDSFACAQSSECQSGDMLGTCEPAGLCSFPDPSCPSGKKFGELAGGQSGQCVEDGGITGSSSGETSSPTTSLPPVTSTTFDPITDSGDTTVDPTAATEVTATTTRNSCSLCSGVSGTPASVAATKTSATQTSEPMTSEPMTTGPTCGAVGQDCVNGTCCGPCTACVDGLCMAGDADVASAVCGGACSACTAEGECGVAPADTPCMADCKDIVWLPKIDGPKTPCYAHDSAPTTSTCDGAGGCKLPAPADCPKPDPDGGTVLAACDGACLKDAGLCSPGTPASEVTMQSFCFLDTETDACQTLCNVDTLSVDPASCNSEGACVHPGEQNCDPYFCDPDTNACGTQCKVPADCFSGACEDGKCQPI